MKPADAASLAPRDAALLRLGKALKARGYRFTTVTPATHARVNGRPGNARARSVEDVFGWSRPFEAELLPADLLAPMQEAGVIDDTGDGLRSRLRASTLGSDLFFHSAYPTEAADAVFFGPDTYRFAAALERHIEQNPTPRGRALDVGCGSGAGAVVIARAWPDAEVLATDINAEALRLTSINARLAGVTNLATRHSDLLAAVDGGLDLVVANPPYLLDPGERQYRHGGGASGEGLSLRIVDAAVDKLAPGGTLLLYTGVAIQGGVDRFGELLASRLAGRPATWRYRELDPDVFGEELLEPAYAHADRIAAVLLTLTLAR
ncbi:methyltransferase [Piscinibacter koreensis]|uniref:Class I SAM-dependent methyltransferase n=1 Tax=Piscinibacter koreensis TaxID=2742824 RepID=A0A7Y6NLI0_9BURK|nr:class I SAM-dependent methyltransferase [Schlegelella koreensis]NUZ05410.1 class I SAM-dependent methyltransferase [Schlegelella koreensis]